MPHHLSKHENHHCIVRPVYNKGPHKYQVFCVDCAKHVQWATEGLYLAYEALQEERAQDSVAQSDNSNHSH